jgi:hypothetical protein
MPINKSSYKTEWVNEQGLLHRTDGPAIEWNDGSKSWWINGKLHRLNGPAYIQKDGNKFYFISGGGQRLIGPLREVAMDGVDKWCLNGYYVKIY